MSQTLQHIQTPPLSQSRFEDMGCDFSYAAKHIEGIRIESAASRRGSEVHEILRAYVLHLVGSKQRVDKEFFSSLLEVASQDAFDALANFADRYEIDYDSVVGTEMRLSLDVNFEPCKPEDAIYQCTVDLVLMPSKTKAIIPDYKSYFAVIEADRFQASFYPLMVLCTNKSIEEVEFVLEFIRYGASRSVKYTREDLPRLKRAAEAARRRQIELHDPERTLRATPGQHCIYCPKLGKSCPMAESNPWGEMSPMERAQFAKWIDEARKENLEKLKQFCIEDGPIVFTDANGVEYVAKHFETADKSYPLAPASRVLKSYIEANPKDHAFFENLTVGGLSSPLKAKSRSSLAQQMLEIAEVKKGTEFGVRKVKEK